MTVMKSSTFRIMTVKRNNDAERYMFNSCLKCTQKSTFLENVYLPFSKDFVARQSATSANVYFDPLVILVYSKVVKSLRKVQESAETESPVF